MALKRLLAQRLFGKSRTTNCRVSSPCTTTLSKASNRHATSKVPSDRADDGIFRRYLHRQSGMTSASSPRFLPTGGKLLETIREMDNARTRKPPPKEEESSLTVKDAVKILKVSQLEFIKARLTEIEKDQISYSEFIEICSKECSNDDQAIEFAKMLDQSGTVIVLGNIVYLRPQQVVKAIQSLIPASPHSPNDPIELQQLEKQKAAIDTKAKSLVQHELWFGLCCFAVQTAAIMRLTFWELSWDVMEPICFFLASTQFMGSYAFFLRTLKEPSFEGLFQSRFLAKQRRLIRAQHFDIQRYNQLKNASSSSECDAAAAAFSNSPAF